MHYFDPHLLPAFEFAPGERNLTLRSLGPYTYHRPDMRGQTIRFPVGETFDGGSIPAFAQSFARPLDYWGTVAYLRHDHAYTLQGGRRCYKSDPLASVSWALRPVSRAYADRRLFVDTLRAQLWLLRVWRASLPKWSPCRLRLPLRIAGAILRSSLIYAAVRVGGWAAWNTIEPETEPSNPQSK